MNAYILDSMILAPKIDANMRLSTGAIQHSLQLCTIVSFLSVQGAGARFDHSI
jgi:hypothetical protein